MLKICLQPGKAQILPFGDIFTFLVIITPLQVNQQVKKLQI